MKKLDGALFCLIIAGILSAHGESILGTVETDQAYHAPGSSPVSRFSGCIFNCNPRLGRAASDKNGTPLLNEQTAISGPNFMLNELTANDNGKTMVHHCQQLNHSGGARIGLRRVATGPAAY
jgi:hypothetical protein